MELRAHEHRVELRDAGAGMAWRQTSPTAAAPSRSRSILAEFVDILRPGDGPAIADCLITKNGSVHQLLNLSEGQLRSCLPDAPELVRAITLVGRLLDASLSEAVRAKPINPYSQVFARYLRYTLGSHRDEHLRMFFLNDSMTLLSEDDHTGRSPTHVSISIRCLIARALELGATGLILAHNHPSGLVMPSKEDIALTQSIKETGAAVGVRLIDHFVVANLSVRSIVQGCAV